MAVVSDYNSARVRGRHPDKPTREQRKRITEAIMALYALRDCEPFIPHPIAIQVARELSIHITDSAKGLT